MSLMSTILCRNIVNYITYCYSYVGACGLVDSALDLIYKVLVRYPLLVMCRSIWQTSHSILPLPTQQWWVPGGRKFCLNGSSCMPPYLYDVCAVFSIGWWDCSSGVHPIPSQVMVGCISYKYQTKLCTLTLTKSLLIQLAFIFLLLIS